MDSLWKDMSKHYDWKNIISIQWGGWEVGMTETFGIKRLKGEDFLSPFAGIKGLMSLLAIKSKGCN